MSNIGDLSGTLSLDINQFKSNARAARSELALVEASQANVAQVVTPKIDTTQLQAASRTTREEVGLIDRAIEGTLHRGRQLADVLGIVSDVAVKGYTAHAVLKGDVFGAARGATLDRMTPGGGSEGDGSGDGFGLGDAAGMMTVARVVGPPAFKVASSLGLISTAGMATVATIAGITAVALLAAPAVLGAALAAEHMSHKFHDAFTEAAGSARLTRDELLQYQDAAQAASLAGDRSFGDMAGTLGALKATQQKTFGAKAGEAAIASLPQVTQLAGLAGVSDKDAVTMQHDIAMSFQLRGRNISVEKDASFQQALNDMLASATNVSGTPIKDLADGLKDLAPVSAQVGWGIRDAGDAVTALSRSQMTTAESTALLNNTLPELQLRAMSNRDAFAEFGISLTDSSGRLAGLPDIANQFAVATEGMSGAQRDQLYAMLGLTDTTGQSIDQLIHMRATLNETAEHLRSTSGAADEMGSSLTNAYQRAQDANQAALTSIMFSVGELANTWKEIMVTPLFEAMAAVMGPVASGLDMVTDSIRDTAHWSLDLGKDLWQIADFGARSWASDIAGGFGSVAEACGLTLENIQQSQLGKAIESGLNAGKDALDWTWQKFTGLRQAIRDLAKESKDVKGETALPDPVKALPKLKLSAAEQAGSEQDQQAESIARLRQHVRDLDAVYAAGGMNADAYGKAMLVTKNDIDKATGGARAEITKLEDELLNFGLSGDQKKLLQMQVDGASAEDIERVRQLQEQLKALKSESDQVAAAQKAENDARANSAKTIDDLNKQLQQLGMTDSEKRIWELQVSGASPEEVQYAQELHAELDAAKALQNDQKRAKELAQQLDPTLKLKDEREELERLHDAKLVNDELYGKGVADLEERWKKAAKGAKEHNDEVNKGLEGVQAFDAIFAAIGQGQKGLLDEAFATPLPMPFDAPAVPLPSVQQVAAQAAQNGAGVSSTVNQAEVMQQVLAVLQGLAGVQNDVATNTRESARSLSDIKENITSVG